MPIDATPGDNYLIKIFNSGNSSLYDVSDATFTVKEPLTMLRPEETDTLIGCNTFPIRFETSGCIGSLKISYSIDGGSNWTDIISSLFNSTSGTRTYNWSVPNDINTDEAKIRVERAFDSSVFDESELFSIRPSNEIDILTPTAGESIQALAPYEITWEHTPVVSEFEVHYQTGPGSTWTLINNNVAGTSLMWEPPNTPTSTARIRVRDRFNSCRFEISDAFTITPAQPVLLSPNGGEEYWPGCNFPITWEQETFFSNVRLEYSDDNGATWNLALSSTSNNGSRNWSFPASATPGDQYLIKASNTADLSLFDVSDAPFTVLPAIEIVSPMAGDTLYGCNLLALEMIKSTCIGSLKVLYSIDNGLTWTPIINTLTNSSSNYQIYESWTIPNGITTDEAIIRVERAFDNTVFAESPVFSIRPSNDITVTAPTAGESINAQTTYQITWDNTSNVSGAFDVHYRIGNGS